MKHIILVNAIEGTTREHFRRHYEAVHAPLGAKYFPFYRYLRSYVVESDHDEYDCLGEQWPVLTPAQTKVHVAGEIGALFEADRALFMSKRRTGGIVEEILLGGALRGPEEAGSRHEAIFVQRKPEVSREAFDATLRRRANEWIGAGRVSRVLFDRGIPGEGNIQGDGILRIWPADEGPGDRAVLRGLVDRDLTAFGWSRLETDETPIEQLTTVAPERP